MALAAPSWRSDAFAWCSAATFHRWCPCPWHPDSDTQTWPTTAVWVQWVPPSKQILISFHAFYVWGFLNNTHSVMIRLGHHIGNLCPAHAILERHLIARLWQARRFQRGRIHVAKHWRAHCILLLPLPATWPHDQAYQSQNYDNHSCYRGAYCYAQHLAVDLALSAVMSRIAGASLGAFVVVAADTMVIAIGIRTGLALATRTQWLIGPGIT